MPASGNGWLYRLYKLRFGTGVVLALPIVLAVAWYAWSAFAQLDRYRRSVKGTPPVDAELFQIALHDELMRDLRRLNLPDRPQSSRLPTFELSLTRANLDALNARGSKEGSESYVPALIRKDGEVQEARVRYRGGQHWHRLMPQKSLKVRLEKGDLVDGARVFNLLNDVTPFGLEDQLVLDLAREGGILTPEYSPVRVRLNNTDMGVYRYEAQPGEGLLRRNHRMPGSMFSGDADGVAVDPRLGIFGARAAWQKVASRSREDAEDYRELERLLAAVATGTHRDFKAFADQHLDLDRYALFDALDVVFGGNEHDYLSNHRFYVDPYTGRFEPVAWSFRGFESEPTLNAVDHPLLIRLKMIPGYLERRNRIVYELLTGKASVPAIRARADEAFERIAPELASDPYWDAYKLLPRASRFHRSWVRPMSTELWLAAAQAELAGFSKRTRFLLAALEDEAVRAQWRGPTGEAPGALVLSVDGEVPWRFRELVASGQPGCSGPFEVFADTNLSGAFEPRADVRVAAGVLGGGALLERYDTLSSGVRLAPHPAPDEKRGRVRAVPDVRRYEYFVRAPSCAAGLSVIAVLENGLTGAPLRLETKALQVRDAGFEARADDAPRFEVGEHSPHPWSFPAEPAPVVVRLGPGLVSFDSSREYGAHEQVEIAPGTRFELGRDVSLTFLGRVTARGTAHAPIVIAAQNPEAPFGGVTLRGAAAAGSVLEWLEIESATRAREGEAEHPGLLNVHDTSSVTIANTRIRGGGRAEDVVHVAYVKDLQLRDVSILDAPVDAVDLEFVAGDVRGLRVFGAGDDCLDLMAAQLSVRDTLLASCTNNGVSAGEETQLAVHRVVVAKAGVGVLAKNGSEVRVTETLLYRARVALKTKARELYYPKPSALRGSELYVVDCDDLKDRAGKSVVALSGVHSSLPPNAAGQRLARQLLGIDGWERLDDELARMKAEAVP